MKPDTGLEMRRLEFQIKPRLFEDGLPSTTAVPVGAFFFLSSDNMKRRRTRKKVMKPSP